MQQQFLITPFTQTAPIVIGVYDGDTTDPGFQLLQPRLDRIVIQCPATDSGSLIFIRGATPGRHDDTTQLILNSGTILGGSRRPVDRRGILGYGGDQQAPRRGEAVGHLRIACAPSSNAVRTSITPASRDRQRRTGIKAMPRPSSIRPQRARASLATVSGPVAGQHRAGHIIMAVIDDLHLIVRDDCGGRHDDGAHELGSPACRDADHSGTLTLPNNERSPRRRLRSANWLCARPWRSIWPMTAPVRHRRPAWQF